MLFRHFRLGFVLSLPILGDALLLIRRETVQISFRIAFAHRPNRGNQRGLGRIIPGENPTVARELVTTGVGLQRRRLRRWNGATASLQLLAKTLILRAQSSRVRRNRTQ